MKKYTDTVSPELLQYIEESVIPLYSDFDSGHRQDHVRTVIEQSLRMAAQYDVNPDMLYAAAACHDVGLSHGREFHHIESGRFIRDNGRLRQWFDEEQIEIIACAAEDHRASSGHRPRSIYGLLVAEADRTIDPVTIIRRTVQYGLSHYPEYGREGQWKRTLEHLHEKYAEGGYLKLWIPDSPNAAGLEALRSIIRDETRLREMFEQIYDSETGSQQGLSTSDRSEC